MHKKVYLFIFISLIFVLLNRDSVGIVKRKLFHKEYYKLTPSELSFIRDNIKKNIVVSPKNIDSVRESLNFIIFGSSSLPTKTVDTVFKTDEKNTLDGLHGVNRVEKFIIQMPFNFKSIGQIIYPTKPLNYHSIILHVGHAGKISNYKIKVINFLLSKGFVVFILHMPLLNENINNHINILNKGIIENYDNHSIFNFFDYPLSYFITPVIAINNSYSRYFKSMSIMGNSGGGWVATLSAAVDSRLKYSYSISGTLPIRAQFEYYKTPVLGDFEQYFPPLFKVIDYTDLYILSSEGNRVHSQVYIVNDPIGFSGYPYECYDFLPKMVSEKYRGNFNIYVDSLCYYHDISDNVNQDFWTRFSEIELRNE
jgi:hypothetical protein